MTEVRSQLRISAPAKRILEALTDSVQVSRWLTRPDDYGSTDLAPEETRVPGYYRHDLSPTMEERVTEWSQERSYAYIIENLGPLKSAHVSFCADPVGDGTLLTQTVNYQMKYGPLGAALDSLVFRPQFRKQMEMSLHSLKNYLECDSLEPSHS